MVFEIGTIFHGDFFSGKRGGHCVTEKGQVARQISQDSALK